jgi:[acyl-carrier-protein] S-malonyltransferase
MGKVFYDNFAQARATFQEVDDALRLNLSKIIFEGDVEKLTLTENAQPAIMATSMAILRALQFETGFDLVSKATYLAGHSLGEYSALCAAGVFSLADTARLLRIRGQAMQSAMPKGAGGMAAIIGLDIAKIEEILAGVDGVCEVANDNCEGQVVISGEKSALLQAMELLKAAGAKRALELNVSAPFHCSLIAPAAETMREALSQVKMSKPQVPVICNVTASSETDAGRIAELLVAQVTGRVRFRESVEYMVANGVEEIMEIGHGAVLTGLCKRISKDLVCTNINDLSSFDKIAKAA